MAPNKTLFFFSAIASIFFFFFNIQVSMAANAENAIKEGACMAKLLPCKDFFKPDSSDPPATCCDPLSEIVLNDPNCLCQAISHPTVSNLNVTLHDVLELTNKCGAKVDSSVCDEAAMLAAEAAPSPNAQAATSAEMTDSLLASLANSTNSTGNGTIDSAAAHSLINQYSHGGAAGPAGAAAGPGGAASGPGAASSPTNSSSSAPISAPFGSFGLTTVLIASYVSTIFI